MRDAHGWHAPSALARHPDARHTGVQEESMEQVLIVTGAGRGIGAAIARRAARDGYRVALNYRHDTAAAEALLADIRAAGGVAIAVQADVGDAGEVARMFARVERELGPVTALVNNAGITQDNLAMRMKDDEFDNVIATNLTAVGRLSRLVLRGMMKAKAGRIINITSVVGASGNPGQMNYAAAKAGVAGMTRALAREIGSRNITVNCVAPGFIDTDMTKALGEARPPGSAERHRARRGLPGRSASRLHHGHRAAREWRHVHELNIK